MSTAAVPSTLDPAAPGWAQTVVAFLAEKERRSGSHRTVESYARMLWPFLSSVGSPDRVTPAHVLAWAHGIGASGREPSRATVGARIACLSSYFRFLIRMGIANANPCDALERPRTEAAPARGLTAEQVRQLLVVIPDTSSGRRDRAMILTFVLTGRRRTEVLSLTAADITIEGDRAFYAYRGKGGKRGRRELPRPAVLAISASLREAGLELATMDPRLSIWSVDPSGRTAGSGTAYARFKRYLRAAGLGSGGLHLMRHTAAKLRRDAGESIEAVSAFLDHSSLAVTTVYLRRLEGESDRAWSAVAQAIGVDTAAAGG